jgi:hypothetical protein
VLVSKAPKQLCNSFRKTFDSKLYIFLQQKHYVSFTGRLVVLTIRVVRWLELLELLDEEIYGVEMILISEVQWLLWQFLWVPLKTTRQYLLNLILVHFKCFEVVLIIRFKVIGTLDYYRLYPTLLSPSLVKSFSSRVSRITSVSLISLDVFSLLLSSRYGRLAE